MLIKRKRRLLQRELLQVCPAWAKRLRLQSPPRIERTDPRLMWSEYYSPSRGTGEQSCRWGSSTILCLLKFTGQCVFQLILEMNPDSGVCVDMSGGSRDDLLPLFPPQSRFGMSEETSL